MDCTFQVGDRVVCVDARHSNRAGVPEIFEGTIYTIAEVNIGVVGFYAGHIGPMPVVRLREVARRHPTSGPSADYGFFAAGRFRPVKPLSFWVGEQQRAKATKGLIERAAEKGGAA